MPRRRFSRKDRERILNAARGCCHICGGLIEAATGFEIEHVIPYALTQDDSDGNLKPAHVKCHREKTHKEDRPRISKAERQRAKFLGTWPKSRAKIQSRGFDETRASFGRGLWRSGKGEGADYE